MSDPEKLDIKVEFTGGLELLFGNKRDLEICMPSTNQAGSKSTVGDLIRVLLAEYIQDVRKELFVQDGAM
ncbi:MAG: hypothetical protein GOMPHAMPRED_003915 [Gomphillus americanus]|uniref:Ubiquitin-related modifier 1 n=1 Tax=Gomphillus americanus TaxID=1940652 RepID=A0A8H3IEX6_9LECA|nr:MAG: hypothetical protein GOMPHAMPRED_003915 [Gomphillus americanus]